MSKKEVKLVQKLSVLLKQLNCREFLHHFGPKKYSFNQHAVALLMKEACRLSFRRASILLDMLGMRVPSYSALCKIRQRIPLALWRRLLALTAGVPSGCFGIDSTGFSRTNPSYHYIKRIGRKKAVRRYTKLSALFDIPERKFCAIRVRVKARHDIKDVPGLIESIPRGSTTCMDASYDAEDVHQRCFDRQIKAITKPKKNAKKGFYRKKQRNYFCLEAYHQRSLSETGFWCLKGKYGSNVSGKGAASNRAELHLKAIAHNLGLLDLEIFNKACTRGLIFFTACPNHCADCCYDYYYKYDV